jgi:beta-mannosidase
MKFFKQFKKQDIGGRWLFNYCDEEHSFKNIGEIKDYFKESYEADVPGNFELDLQANGIIPDPYYGKNIKIVQDYENKNIWYYRKFQIDGSYDLQNAYIVLEGLDCVADIYINEKLLGHTDNMMISHEFNLGDFICQGENEIVVHIRPVAKEALKYDYPVLASGFHANYQSLYIRKPAHMFGWDILPRIISAGIYRPIYIEYRTPIAFNECYLQTSAINDDGCSMMFFYKCSFEKEPGVKWSIVLEGNCVNSSFREEFILAFQYGKHIFDFKNPLLWNPRGSGEQNVYDVKATLLENGSPRASIGFRHGIRTIKLIRETVSNDIPDGEFHFLVNGRKVFAKGTNWVPADAFHSRDRKRITAILDMAAELNCNIIRCWGGNLYEDDLFYDMCDELGIMIWQDFALACAIYPQDLEFQEVIRNEADAVIKRLRQHPCLALWAGDNECDQAYSWFGFDINPNTNVLTRKILPDCVRNHDPFRDFLPSSPYIDENSWHKGDSHLPENHLWGIRDYYKSDYYAKSSCRFASEMGYHGCPSPESIAKFISPENIWPYDNEEWLLHSTSPLPEIDKRYNFRVSLMANQIKVLFGSIPDNIDDFSMASQISQAEAKKFFIELFRGDKWKRTGIIWWNLMDGWPQFSDAVVDYYFNKKLAFDYIKRSQMDIVLMFREPDKGFIELIACSDLPKSTASNYKVTDLDTGETIMESTAEFTADAVTSLGKITLNEKDRRFLMISWDISGNSYFNHYLTGSPPYDLSWYHNCLEKLPGH